MKLRIEANTGPLESRMKQVIARFTKELALRLRSELPWRSTADGALRGVAQPNEAAVVAFILEHLTIEPRPADGATAVLVTPQSNDPTAAQAPDAGGRPRAGEDGEDRRRRLQSVEMTSAMAFADVEHWVREWVNAPFTSMDDPASGKNLDAVDMERGPEPREATVQALLRIIGVVPLSPAERASSERMSAAERLMVRIQEFAEAQNSTTTANVIPASRLKLLTDAVIAAWTEMVRVEVPRVARALMHSMLSPGTMALPGGGR